MSIATYLHDTNKIAHKNETIFEEISKPPKIVSINDAPVIGDFKIVDNEIFVFMDSGFEALTNTELNDEFDELHSLCDNK